MVRHQGLTNYLSYARRAYDAGSLYRAVASTPMSFDATVTSLLVPLVSGQATWLLA